MTTKENLTKVVRLRVSPSEYASLTRVQRRTTLSMSAYLRKLTLEKSPGMLEVDRETRERYKEQLRLCKIVGHNVNQIATALNAIAQSSKVRFSDKTQQCIGATVAMLQLWKEVEMNLTVPPGSSK